MPEGDTVHKVAAALHRQLAGAVLQRVRLGRCRTGPAAPPDGAVGLAGATVQAVYARGKHLFVESERGVLLRSHLGMYGSWHAYALDEPWQRQAWQAGVALWTADRVFVCFNPLAVELLRGDGVRRREFGARLGPDLLEPGFAPTAAVARARSHLAATTPLVDVLLDQWVASGIGNVYKSELLFLAGLAPDLHLEVVVDSVLSGLYVQAEALLRRNLGPGRRVTGCEADGRGTLWVYGRRGRPCLRCGAPIAGGRLGRYLRLTYWCPVCQPDGVVRR